MKATEPMAGVTHQRVSDLVGMAMEFGVSLNLPDLVQGIASRFHETFSAAAVTVGLVHSDRVEAVILHSNDGTVLERRTLSRLTSLFAGHSLRAEEQVHTLDASALPAAQKFEEFPWRRLTFVSLTGSNGERIGLLCLADAALDSQESLQRLHAAARLASMALENSRLFTQITQASKQWAEIFDSLSDFIVLHDENHRVMRANRALADFIGSRPPELIGLHMRDLLAKGNSAGLQPCPFCCKGSGEDEFRHPALDRFYLLSTSRVHGALYEGLQTIHVLRDITERREAQRRYQQLFDNVQEGVFFSTPEGRFLEVNDALVSMLGYASKEELLGIDIPTQLYVSTDHRFHAHQSMRPTGELRNLEIQFRRKDGTLMPAVVNAFAVRSAGGEVLQYRGMIFDMTEVKRFQTQLQRERDFNLQILNNTQNMILVADTAGLISYANRRCSGLEAYGKADLVGNKIAELVEATDRNSWNRAFDQALIGQAVDNLEVQMVLATGAKGRFSVNLSPMRDAADAVTSVVVVMTDITEAAIIQAKLMSTEKLAAVGQLVSGVAHEVNNPLTAIMGFADLMLEHPELPEFAKQDLGVIMQEAVRTKEIVQNLLSFARQTPPQRSVVDVNAILRRAIALRAYDLSSHGVQVVEDLGSHLPEIVADEHQLLQVFLNIINNAYDAVRETGQPGRIEIHTYGEAGQLTVDFSDNGPGVNHLEKIFDPFFTTKPVGKGTGLGLSICYGIVRQHGGEVQCRNNNSGRGATFTIKLPSRQQAKAAKAAHAEYSK